MDIVTGKDVPTNFNRHYSDLNWHNRPIPYYADSKVRLWLYDLVSPSEDFSASLWYDLTNKLISQIHKSGKLPIIVGGTGLYIKTLVSDLSLISVPINYAIRTALSSKTVDQLYTLLSETSPAKAASLNFSDRRNPRRLIRALEIVDYLSQQAVPASKPHDYDFLQLGLTAPLSELINRITARVDSRLSAGALQEYQTLIASFSPSLSSFSACGYRQLSGPNPALSWSIAERKYARRQLTWFKKQPNINWFDITVSSWRQQAKTLCDQWYNFS
jgi:tRNA dimethylallyltransferase